MGRNSVCGKLSCTVTFDIFDFIGGAEDEEDKSILQAGALSDADA